jgi:hypothetical protein
MFVRVLCVSVSTVCAQYTPFMHSITEREGSCYALSLDNTTWLICELRRSAPSLRR